jgi:UV DNA damage endonuclease
MKKLSLCCISLELQTRNIKSSTMTKTQYLKLGHVKGEREIAVRTLNNVKVVYETLKHCAKNNWNYRIGSNLIPLITLPEANLSLEKFFNFDEIKHQFNLAAQVIKDNKIRCSMHPDQFVVPASARSDVVTKSILELQNHANIMNYFGLSNDYNSPINIHMNFYNKGVDLMEIAKRFIDVYNKLDINIKSRLVLENEDKPNSWNIQQLYDYIHRETGIPITYDNLHNKCNPGKLSNFEAYELAKSTWPKDVVPLFHFSDYDPSQKNVRQHAQHVHSIAQEYNNNDVIDLEMEFKEKDYAIREFQQKYPAF